MPAGKKPKGGKARTLTKSMELRGRMMKRRAFVKQAMKELRWHEPQLARAFSELHRSFHLTDASWQNVLKLEKELAVDVKLARKGISALKSERILFSAQTSHGPITVEITRNAKGWSMKVKEQKK